MKKIISLFIFAILFSSVFLYGQMGSRPAVIHSGFYIKLGAAFPTGTFKSGQTLPIYNPVMTVPTDQKYNLSYLPAKVGPAMDLGFLIYIGPSFADNYIRCGIDATFLSIWYNSTNPVLNLDSRYEHFYYFGGQKYGPIITVNPIDKLLIDISYKFNPNFGYHFDEWNDPNYPKGYGQPAGPLADAQYAKFGITFWSQEFSMNIRYRIMLIGFEYNFGTMTYNNFDSNRPKQTIDIKTTRIMIGFKF
jgi:hypothetical protein